MQGLSCAVFGFASTRSLAWGIAEAWNRAGASVSIGIQSTRFKERLEKATADWNRPPHIFVSDVLEEASIESAFSSISHHHAGRLDALAHSLAFAPGAAMQSPLLSTTRADFLTAHSVSAYSLLSLTRSALPLLQAAGGGSVLALSYLGSQRAAKNYNVMGPAKASLEACARGLAAELGPQGIRVNVISAGPIQSLAARGIAGFNVRLKCFDNPCLHTHDLAYPVKIAHSPTTN